MTKTSKQNQKNRFFMMIASFSIAFLLSYFAFYYNKISIFGELSIIFSDMQTQYIPFLAAFKNGDLFFNQNIGLGMNFYPTFAYYLASPVNLLVFLFDDQNIDKAVVLIVLTKLSLAGASMSLYLEKRVFKNRLKAIIFSLPYALMSFGFFFYINFFWFDAIVLLPIVALAVEEILEGKDRLALLVISTSATIITNFYMAYIVGLFVALYTLYLVILSGKISKKTVLTLVVSLVLAVGISAVLTLPNGLFIASNTTESINYYSAFNFTPQQFLLKLFVGFFDGAGNFSAPTIFCSYLVFSLTALYFLNKKINLKQKIASAVFVLFMLVCFLIPAVDIVWHGFSYPNSFPYRYAFCFCFLIISLAARCFEKIDGVNQKFIIALSVVFLMLNGFMIFFKGDIELYKIALSSGFGITYCAVFFLLNKQKNKTILLVLLLAVIAFEMGFNGTAILNSQSKKSEFPLKQSYTTIQNDKQNLLEQAGYFDFNDKLLRVGETDISAINDGSVLGYYGLSFFTSTYDVKFQQLMGQLGYDDNFKAVAYRQTSLVGDSVLGVKYAFSDQDIYYLKQVAENETTKLFENEYAISFGFEANKAVLDAVANSPIAEQNQQTLIEALALEPFDSIESSLEKLSQNTLSITSVSGAKIKGTIDMSGDNILFLSMPFSSGLSCKVDGKTAEVVPAFEAFSAVLLAEGHHEIEISFTPVGFEAGAVISALSVTALIVIAITKRKNFKKH